MGGAAEHLIDGSKRLSFEFWSPHVIEKRSKLIFFKFGPRGKNCYDVVSSVISQMLLNTCMYSYVCLYSLIFSFRTTPAILLRY